jgi:hypothetical protein
MRYADKGRQARRDAAIARPELRGTNSFYDVEAKLPEDDRRVTARAADTTGEYTLPFAVYRRGEKWHNAKCDLVLQVRIVGWRYV